jgi:hypothetical protein
MMDSEVDQVVRTLRIVMVAMLAGVVGFGAIAVILVVGGNIATQPQNANMLLAVLACFAVTGIVAYVVVRTALTGNVRRSCEGLAVDQVPAATLLKGFQMITLIGGALAEGVSFFGIVILLVTGAWLALAAPAVGVVLIALQAPSRDKFKRFAGSVTGQHWG